jgi:UDP-glucose 4-epimerase
LKSALVIGGAGFLGSKIAGAFGSSGYAVTSLDIAMPGDSHESSDLRTISMSLPDAAFGALLSEVAPDVLVHCAGKASVPESMTNPHDDFASHVILTEWLINQCRRSAPNTRFVYLSSAAVYGQPDELPVTESAAVRPVSPYGYHKRMAEMLCEQASGLFGLQTVIARIFSAYGSGLQRQVIWEAARQACEENQISLQGTGDETRDFIHVQDIAQAVILLAERVPADGSAYNVASGTETSVQDVAQAIAEKSRKCSVLFRGTRRGYDPERWKADITKIRNIGFQPSISLGEGLDDVISWMWEKQTARSV